MMCDQVNGLKAISPQHVCAAAVWSVIVFGCLGDFFVRAEDGSNIRFETKQLDTKFRSEGVCVGDFNGDGKQDIAAGSVWYAAPNWEMHQIAESAEEFDPHAYSNSFCNFAHDVDHDNAVDLIVVDFPGAPTWWWKNPGNGIGRWHRHECTPVTNNESPTFADVTGDGVPELLLAAPGPTKESETAVEGMALVSPNTDPQLPWTPRIVSVGKVSGVERFSHGLGHGDINGDQRQDVIVTAGWWEQPDNSAGEAAWKFHSAPFGEACAQMHVYDVDADGDADVISSSAHGVGIWWHEQKTDGWETHTISTLFSQTHSLAIADINGDGLPDLITGKRWWAHGPKGDVDPDAPAVVYWFEFTRREGKPTWIPHQIHDDSGVGTQFQVADVNGDGLLDVAVANKKGVFYHRQIR